MNRLISRFMQGAFLSVTLVFFAVAAPGVPQHEGHNMPGMSKPKPKSKPKPSRKTESSEKKSTTPQPDKMKAMPGMPATSATPSPSPSPEASPAKRQTGEMPGMQMPAASPSPEVSPKETDVKMPAPDYNQSQGQPEEMEDMKMKAESGSESMPGISPVDLGPLMVISGSQMAIRVGASSVNTMPMGQRGSGTSWQPASTPTYMIHKQSGDWLAMFHYNAIVGVNSQGGPRGVTRLESQNWFMPMALRRMGKGTLELRGMFSFEPFTFPAGGSPLLFQTGETYKGQPLIDRQHPHDLFMELSISYTVALGEQGTWFTYFGYPGEPALGPTAFMHRGSASENPSAPLSHHLQDSSHISFGVFTTGFTYRWFKLEGSVFNGREPDENRYDFEAHPWNSRSIRLLFAPNRNWSMQISHGFLRNPEALEPGDLHRTTASITYNKPFDRGNWATSLIWGRNHEAHGARLFNLNGYVAESTVNFRDKNYLYTRLELADKNQLLRAADRQLVGIKEDHPSFRIGAYTFGGARDILTTEKLSVAIGGDITLYSKPATLEAIYGDDPTSYRLFLRFRPGKMSMAGHGGSHGGTKH